jgi:hypothetical protein
VRLFSERSVLLSAGFAFPSFRGNRFGRHVLLLLLAAFASFDVWLRARRFLLCV